jgi:AcrR family transcriptional regulator
MKKSELTLDTIIKTSRALFLQRGYAAVTMKDICDAAHLSRGGLYRYFSSVDEVFWTVLNDTQSDHITRIETQLKSKVKARDILQKFFSEQFDELCSSTGFNRAYIEYFAVHDYTRRVFADEQLQRARKLLERLINYGVKTRDFNEVDPRIAADQILFMLEGIRAVTIVASLSADTIKAQLNHLEQSIFAKEKQ